MSKWFEVTATIVKTYAIEVKNNEGREDAYQSVIDDLDEFIELNAIEIVGDVEIDRLKRHADDILFILDC
jgi:hypothetical protein